MALSKKTVGIIVALIVISVTGLILLQASLLSNAWQLKESAFRRNVMAALGAAVERLDRHETTITAFRTAGLPDSARAIQMFMIEADSMKADMSWSHVLRDSTRPRAHMVQEGLILDVPVAQRVIVQLFDSAGSLDTTVLDTFARFDKHRLEIGNDIGDRELQIVQSVTDTAMVLMCLQSSCLDTLLMPFEATGDGNLTGTIEINVMADDSARFHFVEEVVSRLSLTEIIPIEKRLDSTLLDSVVRLSLEEAGVELNHAHGVHSRTDSSFRFVTPAGYEEQLQGSDLKTLVFPRDVLGPRYDLAVHFPNRDTYLLQQIGPHLASTVLFIAIIIFCFVYTIRTIMTQRRNAALMVDFVNNMTHEFKTPISTVALACEAILRDDVIPNRDKVGRFTEMIQNENRRMRRQTEKILQMAALEDRDYELKLSEVNLHEMIQSAVDNVALQVEHRKGSIDCKLDAEKPIISADRVHVAAIIHNLLDNANKYSREAPVISVMSSDDTSGVFVSISDQGIGIPIDDQKMVFDKFYRVSSGNVHDVKGFGLGLSYVKMMMGAHGGQVSLKSEPGKGTTVRLFFPYQPEGA